MTQELKRNRGRPIMGTSPTRPVNVTLCQEDIDFAQWLGAGNVSSGIRRALLEAMRKYRNLEIIP